MKILYVCIVLFFAFELVSPNVLIGQSVAARDTTTFAQVIFEESEFNFGDLYQGQKAHHIFWFKNSGNSNLVLNNVLSTCGCTVPEWPKEPILPDSVGEIKVLFDSTSKIGRQNKVITIRSNSKQGDYRIRISAMVLPPDKSKNK